MPARRAPRHSNDRPSTGSAPDVLWEFYGSTEGQFTVCSPEEWMARPGTVGRARAGRTLSVDEDGTIWCRAPHFARFSYWRDPAKTDAAWKDGSFSVGDLGRIDNDGYLFLDGRRDDLIISGGVNVYPAEVEAVLSEVAGVGDLAVFGLPDDRWGQRGLCGAGARLTVGPRVGRRTGRGGARPCLGSSGPVQTPEAVRGARRPPPDGDGQGPATPDPGLGRAGLTVVADGPAPFGPRRWSAILEA